MAKMSDTKTDEKPAKVKKAKAKVPCLCGQVTAIYKANSVPSRTAKNGWALEVGRGGIVKAEITCDAETTSRFAPGHDSRLVGLLQDAIRTDPEAKVDVNGDKQGLVDWITGASEHLAVKVLAPAPVKKVKAKAETEESDDDDSEPEEAPAPRRTTSRKRRTV
jgi:hypothetical protein